MRLNNAHQKLGELERANIELTIEVNRLKESINRQKEEWLSELIGGIALLALSVGITWASGGSLPPGTSVQIFKTGQGVPMLGITTPL
jgi:hypothetical protein